MLTSHAAQCHRLLVITVIWHFQITNLKFRRVKAVIQGFLLAQVFGSKDMLSSFPFVSCLKVSQKDLWHLHAIAQNFHLEARGWRNLRNAAHIEWACARDADYHHLMPK